MTQFTVHTVFVLLKTFLDPEGGSQKATLVVVVVISSLASKNLYGFLNTQRSAKKLCTHIRADIAHRSTVSDFSLITPPPVGDGVLFSGDFFVSLFLCFFVSNITRKRLDRFA